VSEHCGLYAGDLIMAINGEGVGEKRHKDAQDSIVRAGNNFTLTVQRFVCFSCLTFAIMFNHKLGKRKYLI
jgi:hypothetical protein